MVTNNACPKMSEYACQPVGVGTPNRFDRRRNIMTTPFFADAPDLERLSARAGFSSVLECPEFNSMSF
jgi:hypothetical protein